MARNYTPPLRSSNPPGPSGDFTASQVDGIMTGLAGVGNAAAITIAAANQTAMLALGSAVQVGDICYRPDGVFVLTALPASTLANWEVLNTGGVSSFNSRTGAVVPASGDYSASQITGLAAFIAANGVASFNSRIGSVVPTTGDYSFSQISGVAAVGQIPSLPASQITSGQLALARGGTNADLSATGGASQFLRQNTVGGAITVVQPAFTDLSGAATSAQIATALTTPGPIGGTTPSTIQGTTITATTQFTGPGTGLTGTAASLTAGTATAANGINSATTTVVVNAATAPIAGQVLTATSGTAASWQTPASASGVQALFKSTSTATVANTTTETSILPTGVGSLSIAGNTLSVGSYLRLTLRGTMGTLGTSPGNQTIKVKLAGLTICTQTLTGVSPSSQYIEIVCDLYMTAVGTSGSINGTGKWSRFDPAVGDYYSYALPGTAQTVNTTGSNTLAVTMTWATASTSNTLTINTATLEQL